MVCVKAAEFENLCSPASRVGLQIWDTVGLRPLCFYSISATAICLDAFKRFSANMASLPDTLRASRATGRAAAWRFCLRLFLRSSGVLASLVATTKAAAQVWTSGGSSSPLRSLYCMHVSFQSSGVTTVVQQGQTRPHANQPQGKRG